MNRTLLLIICDFLLLNLLALTRWDKNEPTPSQRKPIPELQANIAAPQNQDLVDLMKLALENERTEREQILAQKSQTESVLAQARQEVASRKTEAERLQQQLQQTAKERQAEADRAQQSLAALEGEKKQIQQRAAELSSAVKIAEARQDIVREQLEKQLQQAVAEKQAEIERQKKANDALAQQRDLAVKEASMLSTAVKVADAERVLLRENISALKSDVVNVKQEKEKLQVQNAKLADGVTQLAASSTGLAQEIRSNQPVNMNLMFSEFLTNRVDVQLTAMVPGLISWGLKTRDSKTVLVGDGTNVCALLHVTEAPFAFAIPSFGVSNVTSRLSGRTGELAKGPVYFWATDPRVLMVPVSSQKVQQAGVKVYSTTANPFKFTEALLISRGGKYYGDAEFKLDPRTPNYVRMKNRLVNRIFGEFSPSTGDLVLSKTGELLGIMVNADYCAVFKSISSYPGDSISETTPLEGVKWKLEDFRSRVDKLPMPLW